jgi:hypothetical protein
MDPGSNAAEDDTGTNPKIDPLVLSLMVVGATCEVELTWTSMVFGTLGEVGPSLSPVVGTGRHGIRGEGQAWVVILSGQLLVGRHSVWNPESGQLQENHPPNH